MLSNEFFPLRIQQNRCRKWFAADPTGRAYSAPQALAGFKGAASQQEGNRGEGREGLGEGKRGREGKGGMWKGGEKGRWGNSALVVGG